MTILKIREVLALMGLLAIPVSLWFLKEHIDGQLIDSQNETISSLQSTVQAKDEIIAKNSALVESGNATVKSLQDTLHAKDEIIAEHEAVIQSKAETIKSLEITVQTKDDTIKDALIADYKDRLAQPSKGEDVTNDSDDNAQKIYPEDNGFDAQDLGSGFFAYKVFGPLKGPSNMATENTRNHTPWKFGGANSGIAVNGSAYYVSGETNRDSDGKTSTSGQAGSLEYKGSSISQSVMLPAGTYTVAFDYEGRKDYMPANQIAVSIDGTVLFRGAPTNLSNFERVVTSPITLKKTGKYELLFRGLGSVDGNSTYPCTFIDNICINVVGSLQTGLAGLPLPPEIQQ